MRRVAVLGVAQTLFGRQPQRTPEDLTHEAVRIALADAGIGFEEVDAAFAASAQLHGGIGQRYLKALGLTGIPIVNVENACSSGATAIREAFAWIAAGLADVALAFGVESVSHSLAATGGRIVLDESDPFGAGMGMVMPGLYALEAVRYMHEYGATREALAEVSVKNRRNAAGNPFAHQRTPVTRSEVLSSRPICDPLTLLQCCPNSDGAAAIVLASERVAASKPRDQIWLASCELGSGTLVDRRPDFAHATEKVANAALGRAGIDPSEVDLVELHDAFSIGELLYLEQLGLAEPGNAWRALLEGAYERDGELAVSPGGGLIGRGHAMGATGIAQAYEAVAQLRGTAGIRQVPEARIALTHTMGGNQFDLETNSCAVSIYVRG